MRGSWLSGLAMLVAPFAAADEFQLASGGRVVGELINVNESPRRMYVVRTAHGRVALAASSVRRVVQKSAAVQEYETMALATGNSVADHWAMAEKCRELKLIPERERHLEEIIRRQPDHEKARHGLGFTKVRGRWLNTEQWRREQGLILHRGSWRVRQDVENELLRKQRGDLEKDWREKIGRWRRAILRNSRTSPAAVASIKAIRHPRAVPALSQFLREKKERRELKLLYIEVLTQMGGAGAVNAFIKAYMEDKDELVRDRALDALARWKSKRAVAFLSKQLKSNKNHIVNHAARALGTIGDESAVPVLIEALITKHKFQVGGSGISAGFSPGGGGGLNAGGKPKIIEQPYRNRDVLNALIALTPETVNFSFDKTSWLNWYVDINTPKDVELRRIK